MKFYLSKISLFILMCCVFYSCKNGTQSSAPAIKAGTAKVIGKITNYPVKDQSLPWLHITVSYPVTAQLKTYGAQMNEDGSFSFEIPLECNTVACIELDDLRPGICLIPNEETHIELTYIDEKHIKVNMNSTFGLTNEDMENLNPVTMDILSGGNVNGNFIPYNLPPKEFAEQYVSNTDSLQKYIEQIPSLSNAAKNILSSTLKLFDIQSLMEYKATARLYYLNQREDKNTPETFIPAEPDKSYYSFLKQINLNDPFYLYGLYHELTNAVLDNEMLAIPLIKDTPVKDWLKGVKSSIADLVGFDSGLFYNLLAANAYSKQFNDAAKPLSDIQKENIKKYFKNSPITEILLKRNEEIVKIATITFHLNINTTPLVSEEELMATEKKQTPQGKLVDAIVAKYKEKVVVIDFWATWCVPCMMAMEESRMLKQEMLDKDVVFVYLTESSSQKVLWEKKIQGIGGEHYYLTGKEWESISFSDKYGFNGIPTYLLFDTNGILRHKITAYPGNDAMRKIINDLLP